MSYTFATVTAAVVVGVVVLRLGEGVRGQQREAVREAPLELGEQGVVVEEAATLHLADGAQRRRERRERTHGCSSS